MKIPNRQGRRKRGKKRERESRVHPPLRCVTSKLSEKKDQPGRVEMLPGSLSHVFILRQETRRVTILATAGQLNCQALLEETTSWQIRHECVPRLVRKKKPSRKIYEENIQETSRVSLAQFESFLAKVRWDLNEGDEWFISNKLNLCSSSVSLTNDVNKVRNLQISAS